MAEGCGGNSVATTSPASFNWWYLHANHHAWNNNNNSNNNSNHQTNPNSSSCSCEEDISVSTSFTNASNHSSLTVDSSRRLLDPPPPPNHFFPEHADDNHLWNHVLSSNGELQNNEEIGEKFLDALSSKNMTSSMFEEPAYCDYLKKLDSTSNSWEYSGGGGSSSSSFNNNNNNSFDEKNNGFSDSLIENNERLTKLSNLVSTWSIAPPHPQLSTTHHFEHPPPTNNNNNNQNQNQFPQSHDSNCNFKQQLPFIGDNSTSSYNPNINISSYDQMSKVKEEYHHHHQNGLLMNGVFSVGGDINSSGNKLLYHGLPNISSCTRNNNISDVISFNSRLGRPVLGIHAPKASMKYMNLSEPKKHQPLQTSSPINRSNNNGRVEGTPAREVKKKRSEESSEAMKKPKQDTSTASSTKVQAPKVKLGDKITALQQIVSPFGKTDTASVLFEAIGYIKFLQEQVQLLSNPYLKSNSHKDPWGSLDRKDHQKEDGKLDLRSRGLCLVPTSFTALVYRENSGPDYWTPAYRGCLYR